METYGKIIRLVVQETAARTYVLNCGQVTHCSSELPAKIDYTGTAVLVTGYTRFL